MGHQAGFQDAPQEDFLLWMSTARARAEAALEAFLPAAVALPAQLHTAMRYSALGGGKRIRPLLAYAAGAIADAPEKRLDAVAAAIECVHVYSLVHDDLPCMDDDVLRRGRPTCHVEFGEATALLVGDSLQTLAFEILASEGIFPDAARQVRMLGLLAQATGSRGMAGGQMIDLAAAGKGGEDSGSMDFSGLELMHAMKTGALIRAAVLLGALCADAPEENELAALDRYAKHAGLLFQVVDDILDCTASTATLGKTAGKDAADAKPTCVSLMGLAEARSLAADLERQALDSLAPFGERAKRLVQLTAFIAHRSF
ncbi:MAG: polyprenyl synthetase family protein [Betaproteobacteria bacterium]|nr:polyprenyl synthetase family protein [Betaproteobacteria bacterium]